jgi:hypothetical protein
MRLIKTFEQFKSINRSGSLTEALSITKAKQYTSIKRNLSIQKRLDSIFDRLSNLPNATTSKRGDRVYIPFSSSKEMATHESPVKKEVETALQNTDFKLKDYISGVAIDRFGREIKLGKALNRIGRRDLIDQINSDKTRELSKKTDFIIVFSKHPYDIAGASTDRGWTSCMDLYDGENKKYLRWDVKEGSFICYLTKPDDTNLNNPTARVFIKPYINVEDKKDVVYSTQGEIYGTSPDTFIDSVNDIIKNVQDQRAGRFVLSQKLYCDNDQEEIIRYPTEIQEFFNGKKKADTNQDVKSILDALNIKNYTINQDLSVDVDGSVDILGIGLKTIPIKFKNVSGDFNCHGNQLTSLEGAPQIIGGGFWCSSNQLTSLVGAPQKIGGWFFCNDNQLTSLKGGPYEVKGDFDCSFNQLTSLEGAPRIVERSFNCSKNQLTSLKDGPYEVKGVFNCSFNQLTSLEGAPQIVERSFNCSFNQLTSLEGAPQIIGDDFQCSSNQLTSLKGGPYEVKGGFDCSFNQLTSLEGAPRIVDGGFYCSDNPNLSKHEKELAEKNIKSERIH